MFTLPNSHYKTGILLRSLLAIVFMVWLTNVITEYNWQDKPPKVSTKQSNTRLQIEQLTLPPTPKSTPIPNIKVTPKTTKQTVAPQVRKTKQATPTIETEKVEQVYQQLSDEGMDIQIAWPQHDSERKTALSFMYQCVGIQFAVLNGNTLHKVNHTKLNQSKVTDFSDWIRVAQGSLSKKEHNWLNAYALAGTPVRLFPRQLDWHLAQHLTHALHNKALVSLRARYQVINKKLLLTHISINNQAIAGNWVLYQGKC